MDFFEIITHNITEPEEIAEMKSVTEIQAMILGKQK
jgi:hypothetical protein